MLPEIVSAPASTPMAASAWRVTEPSNVFVPEALEIAPWPPAPEPLIETSSPTSIPPARARVSPDSTRVLPSVVPSASSLSARTVPPATSTVPLKELSPARARTPDHTLSMPPFWMTVSISRSTARWASEATANGKTLLPPRSSTPPPWIVAV